jgi:hypothetical protein
LPLQKRIYVTSISHLESSLIEKGEWRWGCLHFREEGGMIF